jgi:hypothetical protein
MTPLPLSATERAELKKIALAATGDGKQAGDWYTVGSPWLPHGAETYIVAGNPDPHAGLYVCDFVSVDIAGMEDRWTEDEWTSRNWALAEHIAAADPNTILRYEATLEAAEARVKELEAQMGMVVEKVREAREFQARSVTGRFDDDPYARLSGMDDILDSVLDNFAAAVKAERERVAKLEDAVRRADEFMTNGIELGYIKMPDPYIRDPASETPAIVRAAADSIRSPGKATP